MSTPAVDSMQYPKSLQVNRFQPFSKSAAIVVDSGQWAEPEIKDWYTGTDWYTLVRWYRPSSD